jgi:hypothetical protein
MQCKRDIEKDGEVGGAQLAVVVAMGCAPPEELVKRKKKKKMWDFLSRVGTGSIPSVDLWVKFCLVLFCFVGDSFGFDGVSCSDSDQSPSLSLTHGFGV